MIPEVALIVRPGGKPVALNFSAWPSGSLADIFNDTAAFNALLKTLEEPPEHVKFIFCTTDPEKIPITVLSRCQRFDFAPISSHVILDRLQQILRQEGRIGRVAPGLRADLAAFEGDPSARIEDLRHPVLVMKDGALYREPGQAAGPVR